MASTTYDIRINASQAERELDKLQSSLNNTNNIFGQLKNAVAGFAIGSFISNTIAMAASLDDIAESSGIALQNVIGFANAVKDSGGSIDSAVAGIGRFARFMEDAADGNKKAQDTFLELGISLEELGRLSQADLLRRTVQGLAEMSDKTQRLSTGIDIFGKSFATVGIADVNADLDKYIANAEKSAKATKAAADAERSFGIAVSTVKELVLQILSPITTFLAALKPETVQKFATALTYLATVIVGLKVINSLSTGLLILANRFAIAGTASTGFITALAASQLASIKNIYYGLEAGIIGLGTAFKVASGGAALFAASLTMISRALLRLIPYVGAVVIAFDLLNSAVKAITDNSIVEWLDEAGKSMAKLMGITYLTGKEKEALAKAQEDAAQAAIDEATAIREVENAMKKETDAMNKAIQAYKASNEQANRKYELDTRSISLGEKQKTLEAVRFDAYSKYLTEITKLESDLEAKMTSSSKTEQAQVEVIKQKMFELTKAYKENAKEVDNLAIARVKETQANQLKLFQNSSLVDSEMKLREISQETATRFLPEIERQYMAISAAAQESAKAAIAAEQARRGPNEQLSVKEIQEYYKAAYVGVEGLIAAQSELNRVNQQAQFLQFGIKERITYENELQRIMNERSKLTMNELQRQEFDLTAQARARAKAEIEAEEARRGPGYRMSQQEQETYYDTALKGLEEIKAANADLFKQSRSFETGWSRAFNTYAEEATNAARQAERIFQRVTQSMEDMMVDFAKTGKFEFKGFLNSVIEDLLRSQIRQLMTQIFNIGGSGRAAGGLLGGVSRLLGFANGGIIPTNNPVIVGERGPELISGASGRVVTPNNQLGIGPTNITYNISAVDAMSFKQLVASDPGFIYAVTQQGAKGIPSTRR
jgi:hypothetical protein